jgi:integrase
VAPQSGRKRGEVEKLPSGNLRVKVYAGIDPVSRKKHFLTEIVPAGPQAKRAAERARTRLLAEVDERRNPRTSATVDKLMERHLGMLDVVPTTRSGYEGYVRLHINPLLGSMKVGDLDADILDSFYAELRRCRDHCDRKKFVQHHDPDPAHRWDKRCRPHKCRPLSNTTVRQVHFLLNGAYKRAVRWRWVAVNPIDQAEPPAARRPEPRPPSVEEAARIINAAWEDPDWGTFIWLAITAGARRGELCAVRWSDLNLERAVLVLRQSVAKDGQGGWYLKDTKTHQQRRIALDPVTLEILAEHRARYEERVALLSESAVEHAFVFSLAPDNSTYLIPESVTQRYGRLVDRLGIETTLHALRHYSATEMISAGVDVRTVAGRLGHSGGGITTLRVYSAWRDEADQRAAAGFASWMPSRPAGPMDRTTRIQEAPRYPYEVVAANIRQRILSGELKPGAKLPMLAELAGEYGVAVSTIKRAHALLSEWGLVALSRGKGASVHKPA